jgi:RHS repeat-associated protein
VGNLDTVKVYSLYNNVYQYDLSGRKTHLKSYKSGNPSQVYLEQSFQYDDAGRDTSTTAGGKTWNLSYYDNNALKRIKYPEIPGDTIRLTESYQIGKLGEITEIYVLLDSTVSDSNLLQNPGFETGNMSNWQGYSASGETVWYVDSLEEILEFSCGDTTGGGTVSHSWQVNSSDPKEGTYSLYSPYTPPGSYADVEFAIQRFEISDYSSPFEASCWVKTNGLEGGVWIGVLFWVDYTDSIRVLTHQYSDKITGTNDWTQVTVTVEDGSYDVENFNAIFYIERMRNNGEVWVDEALCQRSSDTSQVTGEYKVTYEYDKRANRNYSYIKLPDRTEEEYLYKYDNINRLKSTTFQGAGESPSLQYEYTYDAVGNRTIKVETNYESPDTNGYTYNYNTNNNRLTGITETGETFTYNNRGDLLTATGGYAFNYDREGRLEEIIEAVAGDTNRFTFSYTSEGRRFRKVHLVDTSGVVTADTTYYVYDGMFAVAELNGHLDLRSKYVYTNGMLVGRIDSSGEFYQYFHDGLGSIAMIVDSTGQYQNLYIYDDFGDFRRKDEAVSNSYCYTGQERDENPSGLYNLRARYYAAGIGRFTQEDPLMAVLDINRIQELNGYCYVANNPINLIDPLGLCGEKDNECLNVFFDCMVDAIVAPGFSSFIDPVLEGAKNFFYRYPIIPHVSVLSGGSFIGKLAPHIALGYKSFGPVVILATIIFVEEYCIFKEIECLQEQAYEIQEKAYGGCK